MLSKQKPISYEEVKAQIALRKRQSISNYNNTFHFIGLGGAGSTMVEFICEKGLQGKYSIITNPERNNLASTINFIKYIPNSRSKSFMMQRKEIKLTDYEDKVSIPKKVKDLFVNEEIFVLIAGFGSYTGTLLTLELSKMLQENNKPFFSFFSLPFNFEEKRKAFAYEVKEKLHDYDNFSYLDLNSIGDKYGSLKIKDTMKKSDEELYNIIENKILN